MKKYLYTTAAIAMLFTLDAFTPIKQAKAGMSCSTDALGTTRCTDNSGNTSATRTDSLGIDRTTFGDGSSMSCSTDAIGVYRCN